MGLIKRKNICSAYLSEEIFHYVVCMYVYKKTGWSVFDLLSADLHEHKTQLLIKIN